MEEIQRIPLYKSNLLFENHTEAKQAEKLLSWFKAEEDLAIKYFISKKRKEAEEISPEFVTLVDEVERFIFSGGKRVRPAFLYSGYVASGGKAHDAALYASMSVEFLHTFALIHDDIIDRSAFRRGKPTSHKAFEKYHTEKKFPGSKEHFGLSAAILAGDLAYSFAEEVLTSAPFPQERVRRARYYFDQMKFQVIAGEYLDVLGGYTKTLKEDDILNILEYKTAKYTVERPLQIGAMLAGADVSILETFTAYGIPLGQGFQLQDDIFGVYGDMKKTGKPNDSDIKEGKMTVLIAKAYEWSSTRQRRDLDNTLGNIDATNVDIDKVRTIIYDTGAYDYAVKLSHKLIEQAREAITNAKLQREGKEYLLSAASYLISRV